MVLLFCVNFNKQFACINANTANNRVLEMLKMLDLEDRMIDEGKRVNDVLSNDIDYNKVNERINAKKEISEDYLKRAIAY